MEGEKKSYYSIPEAAEMKGISENEIFLGIQGLKIPTKRIGMRVMIPGWFLFEKTNEESINRGEELFGKLKPDFIKILEDAPEFGTCGLVVTLHEGKIVKREKIYQKTEIGGEEE